MTAVLPKNLALIVQRLANFHRSVIRVRPQSNDAASAGQTVTFRLPSNTLVDLHNLQFFAKCQVSTEAKRLLGMPTSMHGIIERLDVVVNGQFITGSNADYGGLHWLMFNHLASQLRHKNGAFLESGNTKYDDPYKNSVDTGAAITDAGALARYFTDDQGTQTVAWPFVIQGFLGFLSGQYVRYIDTAVLGPVEIRIRLAPPSVLYAGTDYPDAGKFNYEIRDMYFFMDTVSFTDDFYRAILARRLLDGGLISIPYQNFFSFQKAINSTGDTVSFNLASQSLDYLVGSFRDAKFNEFKKKAWSETAGNTSYYKFVSATVATADADKEVITPSTTYQYLVNNLHCPTWPCDVNESYVLTRAAFDLASDITDAGRVCTIPQYRQGMFAFVQCFKHHAESEKVISGLDTRGASSNMQFMVNNVATNGSTGWNCIVWAVCTSTLEISAGQNVVTIF